jgi:hypothetical protein
MTSEQRRMMDEVLLNHPHVFERGIPIVGAGPSVMPGTDPLRALIAKENREEARLRKEALILGSRRTPRV